MKARLTILGCLCWLGSLAQQDTSKQYASQELKEDADSLYWQLQQNHPKLYDNWPKDSADHAFQILKKKLDQPLTRAAFSRLLSPFVASFRDGHTYISIDLDSKEYNAYKKGGGRLFPLQVIYINNHLYCSDGTYSKGLIHPGDELLTINGKDVSGILAELTASFPGDNIRSALSGVQRLFGFLIWQQYNWGNEIEVLYKQAGEIKKAILQGISSDEYSNLQFGKTPSRQLHLYPEFSLAVLEINQYSNLVKSKVFIDSCFSIIKTEGYQHVALDLRKNGGGNSEIGNYVLAHISRRPLRLIKSKIWRLGPLAHALDQKHWMYSSVVEVERSWKKISSDEYKADYEAEAPDSLSNPELFCRVNFYLLTSARTFSSAHMTALAVKCNQLGQIIGQPTGERLNLTGEVLGFRLPHTNIEAVVPTASYIASCGDGKQVGVSPDIAVPLKHEDVEQQRDAELQALKQLILKSGRKRLRMVTH